MSSRARALAVVVAVLLATALAGPAAADDGRDVRVGNECSRGSEAELRLRTDDGELRVELRIASPFGARWSVILLRERRIVFRGNVRATRSSGARVRRTLRDLYGRDRVVARASGPRGETCRISATV